MFIQNGLQWLKRVSPSRRWRRRGQGRVRRCRERSPLRLEPLEDRVLLSLSFADKLIPSGSGGEAGYSVAVDGNTAVLGAPTDNNGTGSSTNLTGAAYVFTQSNGTWTQQAKLVGKGAKGAVDATGQQGSSVALSSDDNTLVVGAPYSSNNDGATYVFTRSNGAWSQQAELVGTDANGTVESTGWQGSSVALSSDGNTLVIGAFHDSNFTGAAYVFTRSNGVWTQQAKLVATGATGTSGDSQGASVSLSSDGNTLVVGVPTDGDDVGAAYVFTRSNGTWTQQAKLVSTDKVGNALGSSVSVSGDGNTVAAGAPDDNNNAGFAGVGATYVFTRSNGVWAQQAKLIGTNSVGFSAQGRSVSLSSDGNLLAVGAPYDNNSVGATYLFTRSNGVWSQQDELTSTKAVGDAEQGYSAALTSDGKTLVVGARFDNVNNDYGTGAGFVYAPATVTPTLTISPTTLPDAEKGVNYTQSFTASGGTSPSQFALVSGQGTGLPAGLTFSSDGTLRGIPTVSGAFTFEVQATDSSSQPGPFTQTSPLLTLIVNAPVGKGGGSSGGGSGSGNSSSGGSSMCSCNSTNAPTPELTSVGFLGLLIEELELTVERVIDAVFLDLAMPDGSLGAGINQLSTAIRNDAMFVPADFPGQLAVYLGQIIAVDALGGS
jgi:hypothetical protein